MDTAFYLIGVADNDRAPVPIRHQLQFWAETALVLNVIAVLLWGIHFVADQQLWGGRAAVEFLRDGVFIGKQTALAALDVWGTARTLILAAVVLASVLFALGRFTNGFRVGPRNLHRALMAASVATVVVCWHVIVYLTILTLSLVAMLLLILGPAVAGMLVLTVVSEAVQRRRDPARPTSGKGQLAAVTVRDDREP